MGDVDKATKATVAAAERALKLTVGERVDEANAELEGIDWADPQQAVTAMCVWADAIATAYRKVHGLTPSGRPISLRFTDVDTGEVSSANEVPPEWAWAGQFVAARAAGDHDTLQGLMWGAGDLGAAAAVERINCVFHMAVMHVQQYAELPR